MELLAQSMRAMNIDKGWNVISTEIGTDKANVLRSIEIALKSSVHMELTT